MSKAPVPQLDVVERGELRKCEKVIREGIASFLDVGKALLVIQEGRLHRETHKTFAGYVQDKWELDRNYAYRLANSAKVAENLLPIGNTLPENEAQARPLVGLEPDDQQAAWQDVVEKAEETGEPITAKLVKETVELHQASDEPYEEPSDPVDAGMEEMGFEAADQPEGAEHATEALSMLRKADNQAKAYAKSFVGGLYFGKGATLKGFQERLRAAKASLNACIPVDCPDCPGEGCTVCNGSGLLLKAHLQGDPITPNQALLLSKRGVEVDGMSKKEASQAIDDIAAAEGWEPRPKE